LSLAPIALVEGERTILLGVGTSCSIKKRIRRHPRYFFGAI
jgi:hypothetical protein